jgi:hypothetical protein
MQSYFSLTPYFIWYIYIGGINRACANTNLNAVWVQEAMGNGVSSGMDWGLMPIWVGPQAPCPVPSTRHYPSYINTNPTIAYNEGKNEEQQAYNALQDLGITYKAPVVYDMEDYDTNNASCVATVMNFMEGWDEEAAAASSQLPGVYGTCNAVWSQYAALPTPPKFIWGAYWDNNEATSDLPCVSSGNWVNHQRHKQYQGGHNETWNGVTLNVDSDCSDSDVVSTYQVDSATC